MTSPICWLCHSGRRTLSSGFCACLGSLSSVHHACLQQYVTRAQATACPTCNEPYCFEYADKGVDPTAIFSSAHGAPPPPPRPPSAMGASPPPPRVFRRPPVADPHSIGTWLFLCWHFALPFLLALAVAIAELAAHWLCAPVLIGASLLGMRGGGAGGGDVWQAWIVGASLQLMYRRMINGKEEIIRATTESSSSSTAAAAAAVAAAASASAQQQRQQQQQMQQPSDGDAVAAQPDLDGETASENSSDGDEDHLPGGVDADGEDGDAESTSTARTVDQVLWMFVDVLREVARSPDRSGAAALGNLVFGDTPRLILHAWLLGFSPAAWLAVFGLGLLILNTYRYPAPKLDDLRQRYEEAGRRMRSETTERDLVRYEHIYMMDIVLLFAALPLCLGYVAHEALASTPVAPVPGSAGSWADSDTTGGWLLQTGVDFVSTNSAVMFTAPDGIVARVWRRFATTLDRPSNALVHWLLGYALAGVISAIESRIISPLFAPGVSLVFFRSFSAHGHNAEIHSFAFMLRQLFDLNTLQALRHCVALFAAFLPLAWIAVALLTNAVRVWFSAGAVIPVVAEMLLSSAVFAFDPSAAAAFAADTASGASNIGPQLVQLLFAADTVDPADAVQAAVAALARNASQLLAAAMADNWARTTAPHSLPASILDNYRFLASLILIGCAGGAFYLLPHQFIVLRRIDLDQLYACAASLGLDGFLFDPDAKQTAANFMELSRTLPVNTEQVVDLQPPPAPIAQLTVRRERWLPPEQVPSFLQMRVGVFTAVQLVRLYVGSWVVLLGGVSGALVIAAGALCSVACSDADGIGLGVNASLHANPVAGYMPTSGLELLAVAFISVLVMNGHALPLLMSCGYLLITPIALIVGLADVFRPLAAVSYQAQLQMTLESVWCAAYNLRRIVVPRRPLFATPVDRVSQIMRQVD